MERIIVRINHPNKTDRGWYSEHAGCSFEVKELNNRQWKVVDSYGIIMKDDCEIVRPELSDVILEILNSESENKLEEIRKLCEPGKN
jgi:hypothetical protein